MECATLVIIAGYFAQVLVHTFIEGFYSFIPQIIYGILLLSLIAQLQIRKKSADIETSFAQTYPLLFLAALGGSLTWFLPLPALIIFLVILALGYLVGKHWRQTTKSLVRASLAFMPVYFLAALAVLVQYHVLATDKSPGSVGFFQGLLLNGGITIYDPTFYLLFGIGLVAFFVMIRRASNQKNAMANGSLLFFACMMAFISVIYIYQQLKLNTNVYYYYKLVYLLLAIATPLVVTGYAYLIQRIAGSPRRVLLYAVLFFCLLLNFVGIEPTLTRNPISTYPAYLLGKRKITPAYDEVIYQNLRNVSTEKAFSDNNYFFMYTVGKPQIDTASLLLRTNKPISPCSEAVRSTFIVAADIYTTDKTAQSACVGRQIYLVVSDADKQTLGKLSLQKLRVITYAQAEGHSPL